MEVPSCAGRVVVGRQAALPDEGIGVLPECGEVERGPGGKRAAGTALGQLEHSQFFWAFPYALIKQIFPEHLLHASLWSQHWDPAVSR